MFLLINIFSCIEQNQVSFVATNICYKLSKCFHLRKKNSQITQFSPLWLASFFCSLFASPSLYHVSILSPLVLPFLQFLLFCPPFCIISLSCAKKWTRAWSGPVLSGLVAAKLERCFWLLLLLLLSTNLLHTHTIKKEQLGGWPALPDRLFHKFYIIKKTSKILFCDE